MTARDWEAFYKAHRDRDPRPRFLEALARFGPPDVDEPPRFAVDLGCGTGRETLHLLGLGWSVLAIDAQPSAIAHLEATVPEELRARLETRVSTFQELTLPPAHFVHAGFSLPFCPPDRFDEVWRQIERALIPGARFAGELFGPNDTWADDPLMTFHRREEVASLLTGWIVENLAEVEEDRPAVSGPKHWHVYHITARRPLPGR